MEIVHYIHLIMPFWWSDRFASEWKTKKNYHFNLLSLAAIFSDLFSVAVAFASLQFVSTNKIHAFIFIRKEIWKQPLNDVTAIICFARNVASTCRSKKNANNIQKLMQTKVLCLHSSLICMFVTENKNKKNMMRKNCS